MIKIGYVSQSQRIQYTGVNPSPKLNMTNLLLATKKKYDKFTLALYQTKINKNLTTAE